ncbi:MAG TPA: UvrD-helicase domain-containing protein, partial [Terrimesophilobacter sp.]|nr:UvrD-helicase domain-containing protein [Terrimesophilobacter sp.]
TLPAVMGNLLKRLAPDIAERVEFVNVHSFASRVLRARGVQIKVDSRRAGQLLGQAWATLDPAHRVRLEARAATGSATKGNEYWKEEVESVIKGRGFTTFDEYADCARPGRLVRLNVDDRRVVWALFQEYERLLRSEGINDFQDQVLLAETSLRRTPLTGYAAVIVDEAQDLSLAMIRMLHSLVGDAPDAFTLIGDGQQSIYPGGYVLSEAGISLAGRGVVMDHNYRNTAEIQAFAATLIADSTYTDIDDQPVSRAGRFSPAEPVETPTPDAPLRHGPTPEQPHFPTRAAHDKALVARIQQAVPAGGMNFGDIAILCDTNAQADAAKKLLAAARIPSINLLDYQGLPTDAVKVGTIKRAKGLEFKLVMLPWSTDARSTPDDERAARDLRERYVAATRARDALWVGVC